MLEFKTFLRLLSVSLFVSAISGCALIPGSGAGSPLNKNFTPSLFEITFYEIGLRNSQTSARAAIFKNESGAIIDLAIPASMRGLAPPKGKQYSRAQIWIHCGQPKKPICPGPEVLRLTHSTPFLNILVLLGSHPPAM